MMKAETHKASGLLLNAVALFIALLSAALLNFKLSSNWVTPEFSISATLIIINFLATLFLDHKAMASKNFLIWGMLFKMAKSFFIFLVLAAVCILKLVQDPKLLAFTFLLGFTITMIFEVVMLQKLIKKKQD